MSVGSAVIGVDLAWGERARSGLCHVTDGRVAASASLTDLDEIVDWVSVRRSPGLVVAVDAPLVVANATGRRPCDDAVSRLFGAAEAGAHSCNRKMPAFRDGGRAARLAQALGLPTDPDARGGRVIEVYPHPALVAIFGLGRSLKYKRRHGRDWEVRGAEFGRLIALLERLRGFDPPLDVTSAPRWGELRARIGSATTHAELDRAEDELDAFVCAYVGVYHLRWAGIRSFVVGDLPSGYIVTPLHGARHAAFVRSPPARPLRCAPRIDPP